MLSWLELSQQLQKIVNAIVRFVKARKREEATIGLAAILFWFGYSFPKLLTPELKDWIGSWRGLLVVPGVLYAAGAVFLCYGGYRIWQLVLVPDLPPPKDRPSAIKGPIAFTPADGELFRQLGREEELRKLLGFIEDDQVRLVVLMGASGVGKTSLLRAGLTNILKNKGIDYHYWEAVPTAPGQRLLRAIQESWQSAAGHESDGANQSASAVVPASLEDLVNPAPALGERRHVIVLDQFEQLHGSSANNPILRLLRKVAREAKPPHRVTWVVAFRREFRAEWEDFTLPDKERGIYPTEISLHLFTEKQARDVISQLIAEAQLSIQQKVVDNLVAAAAVNGEVSPVDIGIGLLVLAELHDRRGGQTVTLDDYQFAGGAEGLLMQYINRCLDIFSENDRETILKAMLALREVETNQRISEGRTCDELAEEIGADSNRLNTQLERLIQRDMRLLEIVPNSGESSIRYRLPHERLIPALQRMAGQLLADVDLAKLRFENAFTAWKNGGKGAQYLLKAKALRSFERYKNQIPWGNSEAEKRDLLHRSRRRLMLRRLEVIVVVLCLLAASWIATTQYQRYEGRTYLTDNHYPTGLYDWQHQLKILEFKEPINTHRLPWLHSDTLEELVISVSANTNSLEGLGSLARCRSLKTLTLTINNSEVKDLTALASLTNLTQLKLNISNSEVNDLTPLAKLTKLTHLEINIDSGRVSDISPLASLTALKQLNLRIADVSDFKPLAKLTALERLKLDLGSRQKPDFSLLASLTNLTHLEVDLGGKYSNGMSDLTPLSQLAALKQLDLHLVYGQVKNLMPLTKLAAGTKLNLYILGAGFDLTSLAKLTALNQLDIYIDLGGVKHLISLASLTSPTQLNLHISTYGGDDAQDLTPLSKLPTLKQLDLELRRTEAKDITALASLTNLTQLNLNIGASDQCDIRPLAKLTALTKLGLTPCVNQVTDLSPLASLTNLTQLDLTLFSNPMDALMPLAKLTSLKQLKLDIGWKVEDITALASLTSLTQLNLDISGSKVSDLTPLATLTALTQLDLYLNYNDVRELAPLSKLTSLRQLNLSLSKSKVNDLTPLTNFHSCQTFMLNVRTDQRMSLKEIPSNVIHLGF